MTDKPAFQVSVRDLAEFVWRRGDLGLEPGPIASAAEGMLAHRRLQRSRGEGYRAEVPLSLVVERGDIELRIAGRADGLMESAVPLAVEEIKTVASPPLLVPREGSSRHWAQAELYAAILARTRSLPAVDVRLAYVHFETGQVGTHRRERSREWLEAFLEETLDVYFRWLAIVVDHRRRRDAALAGLRLPYPSFRPGQRALADTVQKAAARGPHGIRRHRLGRVAAEGADSDRAGSDLSSPGVWLRARRVSFRRGAFRSPAGRRRASVRGTLHRPRRRCRGSGRSPGLPLRARIGAAALGGRGGVRPELRLRPEGRGEGRAEPGVAARVVPGGRGPQPR